MVHEAPKPKLPKSLFWKKRKEEESGELMIVLIEIDGGDFLNKSLGATVTYHCCYCGSKAYHVGFV
jgi:hypothetical protein